MRHKSTRVKNLNLWKCPIQMKPGDQDGDGRLGYHDFAWLGASFELDTLLPEEAFGEVCEKVGATNKLLTKDQLYEFFKRVEDEADVDVMEVMEEILDMLATFKKVES